MMADHKSEYWHSWRQDLSIIVFPLQKIVDAPIKFTHVIISSVSSQKYLLEDNARLHAHELLLEAKLQKLLVLERENRQLRELLRSTAELTGKVQVAQLLAVNLNPALQELILDKGSKNQVYVGQPVLDAYGVMGQVVDTSLLTSKVLLLTDTRSVIPVQDSRNGLRAVAAGLGAQRRLALLNVLKTTDVKVGDLFIASGLGLRFPVGYPVGVVIKVAHIPGQRFATVVLQPTAHFDQTQQVLLARPSKAALSKAMRRLLAKPLPEAT